MADFLRKSTCENLYLVGDIVDVWELQRKFRWSLNDSLAVRQILKKKRQGSNVFYLPGNHDGAIRSFINHIEVEGVEFANEFVHIGVDGRRYLVVHGDIFDSDTTAWTILSKIGGRAYDYSIIINAYINKIRAKIGKRPWSLSNFLKQRVKGATHFIRRYEKHMIDYCSQGGYDGIICGHIHKAEIKTITSELYGDERMAYMNEHHLPLIYMNSGDWVESCTALVENMDGSFEIIRWSDKKGNHYGQPADELRCDQQACPGPVSQD